LDSAFGESSFIGKRAQACFHGLPTLACGAPIKKQIDEEGRWLLIVSDDIAHENVQDVVVDWHSLFKTGHF
jgi:hypothetical protein